MMSNRENKTTEKLSEIIRGLADVWPNDRDNVATAGAQFEEVIEELDQPGVQLKKLIDLAWAGLKHLFQEDDYFLSVKNSTMQAVNIIREYLLNEGNIPVEEFEKARTQLEKSLTGEGESADSVIELDVEKSQELDQIAEDVEESASETEMDEDSSAGKESDTNSERNPESPEDESTLDDLASCLIAIDPGDEDSEGLKELRSMIQEQMERSSGRLRELLEQAQKKIEQVYSDSDEPSDEWLTFVSSKIEEAIEVKSDQEWAEDTAEAESETDDNGNEVSCEVNEDQPEEFVIPEDTDLDMIQEFVTECNDLITSSESALLDLESTPDDEELINTVFRGFHTIKGTSAFMGLDPISEFTHSAETLLSMVRDGELKFDTACADICLESVDILKKLIGQVESASGGDPLPLPDGADRMQKILDLVCNEGVKPSKALDSESPENEVHSPDAAGKNAAEELSSEGEQSMEPKSVPQNGKAQNTSKKAEGEATVRVNVGRLDRLIDMVGELVIAHSVVAQDSSIADKPELSKKISHASKILRELQDTSLTLRMVPMRPTFQKMNRLVRDLSRKAGKKVKFSAVGEETEIDRNMVDVINEPLVHMLRNAIDHGIEDPDSRKSSGKEDSANVWLRAYQEGGKVVIEIEDDGRGIDKEKVLKKAVEKGLVESGKSLTDKEIYKLIFLPGFSSADQVTDLSGRGVGMDVVRRSIEQLQGKVDVDSELGVGTKISIELPFTLAITDGMLVKVGSERFIIPTMNIDKTFRATQDDIFTIMGDVEQVHYMERTIPVIRLHQLFTIHQAVEDLENGTLLVIKNDNRRYALLVDEVIGQQQLVGKSIDMNVKMPHVSGGAILGDGQVGLILDTATVFQQQFAETG